MRALIDTCVIMDAVQSRKPFNNYEDAVMIETAIREKMDYIVTRNLSDYQLSPIKVLAPGDFIQTLSASRNESGC